MYFVILLLGGEMSALPHAPARTACEPAVLGHAPDAQHALTPACPGSCARMEVPAPTCELEAW